MGINIKDGFFSDETFREDFTYKNSPQAIKRFPFPFDRDDYMYAVNLEPHTKGREGSVFEFAFDVEGVIRDVRQVVFQHLTVADVGDERQQPFGRQRAHSGLDAQRKNASLKVVIDLVRLGPLLAPGRDSRWRGRQLHGLLEKLDAALDARIQHGAAERYHRSSHRQVELVHAPFFRTVPMCMTDQKLRCALRPNTPTVAQ